MNAPFTWFISGSRFHRVLASIVLAVFTGCSAGEAQSSGVATATPAVQPAPASQVSSPASDLATNAPAAVGGIETNLHTIFIAGDSTAARGAGERQQGWGVLFASYFDPGKINIANRARGGRSSRTFVTEGLWDKLLDEAMRGDTVLIQFGMNDGGAVNDASRARGSLPGLGEETQEIDNQITKKHEVVHTYGWYIAKMVADAKAKGATPIVLSPTVRNVWKNGHIERGPGHYAEWASDVARNARVQFIDVTDDMADKFDAMGEEKVKEIYIQDHTHFNAVGADMHAASVVSGLRGLGDSRNRDSIRKYLSDKGLEVHADNLAWLNLPHPNDWSLPSLFLIGDSTVRNGHGDGSNGQWGWGDFLAPLFDETKINVVNRAVGGTTSRSYYTQDHWQRVLGMLKPGDFVIMQFGANDNGSPNAGRTSIKGAGEETLEVDDPVTKKHEVVYTFGGYMRKFVADARAKGATPIVCSLTPRNTWRDGHMIGDKATHGGWAEQAAKQVDAPFVDLNQIIAHHYDELGQEKVLPLYADGHLHTGEAGAKLNAQCVVEGLKALSNDPLAAFLK